MSPFELAKHVAFDNPGSRSLATVDISRNQLGDDAVGALARAIQESAGIVSLSLSGNAFTTEGKTKLHDAAASKAMKFSLD